MLKNVWSGVLGGWLWLIFVKEDGKYSCFVSFYCRFGFVELEFVLYNVMVVNFLVIKFIKFFCGFVLKE